MATRTKRQAAQDVPVTAKPGKRAVKPEKGASTSKTRAKSARTTDADAKADRAVNANTAIVHANRERRASALRQYAETILCELKGNHGGRTWTWAFLEVLARGGNVTLACYAADTDRQNAYQLRKRDKTFAEMWDAALEMAADLLEEEAWRRACDGVARYVVSQGKVVLGPDGKPLIEEHYSDMLLDRLLRAARPEKFRDTYAVSGGTHSVVKVYYGFDPDQV